MEKNEELQQCKKEKDRLGADLDKESEKLIRLMTKIGKLEKEAETHIANVEKRDCKLKEIATEYGIEGFAELSEINDKECERFCEKMKGKLQKIRADAETTKAELDEKEKQLQEKIDTLKANKAGLEEIEKIKTESMKKNEEQIKELTKKLDGMMNSEQELTTLNTELREAEKDLQSTSGAVNVTDLKNEIARLETTKRQLDEAISKLDSEMNVLHSQTKAETELEMLKRSLKEKESTINRLRDKHQDNIVRLLGHMPVDDVLRESIDSFISTHEESYRQRTTSRIEFKSSLSCKKVERTRVKEKLEQEEEELRGLEEKIDDICKGRDMETVLTEVQTKLNNAQDEKGPMLGKEYLYKLYIQNLEKDNPDCPLCHRRFEQGHEARDLISELQYDMTKVPTDLSEAEENVRQYQKQYDDLMQLRPQKAKIRDLKDNGIPGLKIDLEKIDEDVKKLEDQIQSDEDTLGAVQMGLKTAKDLQADVVLMDQCRGEMKDLGMRIESQRAMLPSSGFRRSMDEVIVEKKKQQDELDNTNRNLDETRDRLDKHQENVQRLQNNIHNLRDEKSRIVGELQEKTKLEETKASLASNIATYQKEREEARDQMEPMENQIKELAEEKDKVTRDKNTMIEEARMEEEAVKQNQNMVKNIHTEIIEYLKSGKQEQMVKYQEKKSQLDRSKREKGGKKKDLDVRITQLIEYTNGQEVQERRLKDTLEFRNKKEEITGIEKMIEALVSKLGGMDERSLEEERKRLIEDEEKLIQDKHETTGRQQGFREQIESKKTELQSEMYKDAAEKYREKVIDNKTLEMANRDLQKYYNAMEQAITRYHNTKMEEINIIIRELWAQVYQGNDIDAIEICSEVDAATGGADKIKKRGSYNYRVVMIKNKVEIDMRGRCSAGQKVLASIIIRLALAETFCVNCGVLALDEPTTNLDTENIEHLGKALLKIVQHRSAQKHFQLVVITHNEDFVQLLGQAGFVDRFVAVSKNPEGKSMLHEKYLNDLNTHSHVST